MLIEGFAEAYRRIKSWTNISTEKVNKIVIFYNIVLKSLNIFGESLTCLKSE